MFTKLVKNGLITEKELHRKRKDQKMNRKRRKRKQESHRTTSIGRRIAFYVETVKEK